MEEKNDLIIYGENGEIQSCSFQRVDLNTPSTILSYCSDVIDAIGNVLDSTAQMAIETEQERIDSKTMDKIQNFGKELDESEKEQKSTSLVKGAKKFLGNLGIKYFQESLEKESYKGRYEAYCDMLNQVVQIVEHQKQSSLNDIEFINGIIAEMNPLIDQLEAMIQVGHKDKEAYDKETEELKQISDPNDMNVQRGITFRTKISEAFQEKLNKLENMLTAYRQQIDSYKMQQLVDMGIVTDKEDYLRHSSPMLKSQGSLMINNRIQAEKLAESKALNAAVNNAITQNAQELLTNIEASVDLSVNGGITTQSLEVVSATLTKGMKIINDSTKLKEQKIAKDAEARKRIKAAASQFNESIINFLDAQVVTPANIGEVTEQKRIGGKK